MEDEKSKEVAEKGVLPTDGTPKSKSKLQQIKEARMSAQIEDEEEGRGGGVKDRNLHVIF